MSPPIEELPTELFLHILEFLRHHDLTVLARVSRRFQHVIEPIIWTRIELHPQGFHEHYIHKQLREQEEASQRPYHHDRHPGKRYRVVLNDRRDYKALQLLVLLQNKQESGRKQKEYLASLVRWLCLPVHAMYANYGNESDPWNALARLTDLEYLEISAFWKPLEEVVEFEGSMHPMSKLRTLRLRGYIPADFVRHLCHNAGNIEELELGLLDAPTGPVGHVEAPLYPPSPTGSEVSMRSIDSEGEVINSFGNAVAPRPLACLTPSIISQFTSLSRLYLCRPSEARDRTLGDGFWELYTSIPADRRILNEWASLLQVARNTLMHITFDQRPVGDENEPDGTGNEDFMWRYCHGPGYHRFAQIVLPVLLEEGAWPALQSIQLFGFEFDGRDINPDWNDAREGPGLDIDKQLQERFPNVVVASALGRRMLFMDDTGEAMSDVHTCNSFSDDEWCG